MPGLNFYTTTIINKNLDPDSGKGVELFKFEDGVFHVKREFRFKPNNVEIIRKRNGFEATLAKSTIDFTDVATAAVDSKIYARLDVYVKVEGAEPFIFANPWIQKGKPFWIEFTAKKGATAATILADLVKQINKHHIFQVDNDIIKVSADGTKLVLEAQDEFLRIDTAQVVVFNDTDEDVEVVAEQEIVERGLNSFGTFSQLTKDLRLPTPEHTAWDGILQVERPIVGAIYDQYIITYTLPSNNDGCGLQAVGQRLTTTTTHVFWVNHDIQTEWETELNKLGATVEDADA